MGFWARAQDLEGYYRIPADTRDLNYDKYFVEGELNVAQIEDYTSHNTERLDIAGVEETLKKLSLIEQALKDPSNKDVANG